MKGKIRQIILVNIIFMVGFFTYLYQIMSLPACTNKTVLLLKSSPLILVILMTVLYNIFMQKKINAERYQKFDKGDQNARQNLENRKNI